MSPVFFRASVGACVLDPAGRVLALKRKGTSENAWQMPQGGIEVGEIAQAAVLRELQEETGLLPQEVEIIAEHPEWLVYELPAEYRNAKVGWGQAQRWFLLRATASAIAKPDGKEFEDCAWLKPAELMPRVVAFRRPAYDRVFAFFARDPKWTAR